MDGGDGLLDYISGCLDDFEDDRAGRSGDYAVEHAEAFVREYAERFENTLRGAVQERASIRERAPWGAE